MAKRRKDTEPTLTETFQGIKSDYDIAATSRFTKRLVGVAKTGSGADYHWRIQQKFFEAMERAREFDRNHILIPACIDRNTSNVVQNGFSLDAKTGDRAIDRDLTQRFGDWGSDPDQCDAAGERTFFGMESLVPRHVLVDGDILALPTRDGSLQLVEAHRLRTPKGADDNVVLGVELDSVGRRIAYHVTQTDVNPMAITTDVTDIQRYPARDSQGDRQVFHIYDPTRVSQTRGVTALANISNEAGMLGDVLFAQLLKAQISSCVTFLRTPSQASGILPSVSRPFGETTTEQQADGSQRIIQGIAPGMELTSRPGEQITGFSPQVTYQDFYAHCRLIIQLVGINIGLPLVISLMDASETNFSGFRGAVDEARRGFRRQQKFLIEQFYSPVYRWKVRQWLATDPALARAANNSQVDIFGHKWQGPSWGAIDPLKDATAFEVRRRSNQDSPRGLVAESGREWEEVMAETVEDNAFAFRQALEAQAALLKDYPDADVSFRDFLTFPPTPAAASAIVYAESQDQPATAA